MERANDADLLGQDFSTVCGVRHAYSTERSHSWQERLGLLGLAAYEASEQWKRDQAAMQDLCEQVKRLDPGLAARLSNQWSDQIFGAAEAGTRIGYALARTWPDGLEGLEDWLARARAMAGIDDVEDGEDPPEAT